MAPVHVQAVAVFKGDVAGFFSNASQLPRDIVSISNKDYGRKSSDAAVFEWGATGFEDSCSASKKRKCKAMTLPQSGSSMRFDGVGSDKGENAIRPTLGKHSSWVISVTPTGPPTLLKG